MLAEKGFAKTSSEGSQGSLDPDREGEFAFNKQKRPNNLYPVSIQPQNSSSSAKSDEMTPDSDVVDTIAKKVITASP